MPSDLGPKRSFGNIFCWKECFRRQTRAKKALSHGTVCFLKMVFSSLWLIDLISALRPAKLMSNRKIKHSTRIRVRTQYLNADSTISATVMIKGTVFGCFLFSSFFAELLNCLLTRDDLLQLIGATQGTRTVRCRARRIVICALLTLVRTNGS